MGIASKWQAKVILGLAVLVAGLLVWIWMGEARTGQDKVLATIAVTILAGLLALPFAIGLLPRGRRLLGFASIALILVGLIASLRIQGVTGNLRPILGWRWGGDGERGEFAGPVESVAADALWEYPQFLGPQRRATVPDPGLSRDWRSTEPREVWRRDMGAAWSAFAIQGRLAVTQEQWGDEEAIVAYDLLTGEEVWAHTYPARYETTIAGIGPRATPTISGERVLALGATGVLSCLDRDTGTLLWSRDVVREHGAGQPEWGRSGSPLVVEDLVVVSVGGGAGSSLVAYRVEGGGKVWSGGSDHSSYSSPTLATFDGVMQIVVLNVSSVAGHDPVTGEVLWTVPWSARQPNVAVPVELPGDRLLVSSGYGVGSKVLRVRKDQSTGAWSVDVDWESPRLKAKFTNPVFHDGYVYGLDDGVLVCLDPDTGERCWKKGRYGHGQVILAGQLLLVQTEKGDVVLLEPTPEGPNELGRFSAFGSKTWNCPALAGNLLLLRNHEEAVLMELPLG